MTTHTHKIAYALIGMAFTLLLSGCSEEKPTEQAATSQQSASGDTLISKDSPTDPTPEAEETQKQKFEREFATQCTERELNNSANNVGDADKITKSCGCIAAYIAKDLTDEEAEKFNVEHENPQSIRIKFEAAAYECLQEKAHPPGPKMFGKPE